MLVRLLLFSASDGALIRSVQHFVDHPDYMGFTLECGATEEKLRVTRIVQK